ncbi:hypothetical protein ACFV4E_22140 [Streptomyces hygroscopicus]|nr:hypothetical protein [Streptomyces sp. RKCA744]
MRRGAELLARALKEPTSGVSRTSLERDVGSARQERRVQLAEAE